MHNQSKKANGGKVAGEWVGYIIENSRKEFIRVEFDEQWCDLPERKQYGMKVFWEKDDSAFQLAAILS